MTAIRSATPATPLVGPVPPLVLGRPGLLAAPTVGLAVAARSTTGSERRSRRPATYPPDGRPGGRIRPRIVLAPQASAGYHAVRLYLSGGHGTLFYLFALTVAWWTLRGADPRLAGSVLLPFVKPPACG